MAEDIVIDDRLTIPANEVRLSTGRARGPGGQHVNTSDTAVELRWNPADSTVLDESQRAKICNALAARLTTAGDLLLSCGTHRSQRRNRMAVHERLAELLRAALRPRKRRRSTRATAASRKRDREAKKRRGELKRQRRKPPIDD